MQSENSTSTDSSTTIYKQKKPNNKKKTVKNTDLTRTKNDTLVVLESDINNGNYFFLCTDFINMYNFFVILMNLCQK